MEVKAMDIELTGKHEEAKRINADGLPMSEDRRQRRIRWNYKEHNNWSSDMDHYAYNNKFRNTHGWKRKKDIWVEERSDGMYQDRDDIQSQRLISKKYSKPLKRLKATRLVTDETRDMGPSSYSSLGVRKQEDSLRGYRDENHKERHMSRKLAHRLINRFEKHSSSSDQRNVDSSDLVPAMALASLAYHSPNKTIKKNTKKNRHSSWSRAEYPRYESPHGRERPPCDEYFYDRNTCHADNKSQYYDRNTCHADNKWICDYCRVAAFDTYEEACEHEKTCGMRHMQHSEYPSNCVPIYVPSGATSENRSSIPIARDEEASDQRSNEESERTGAETEFHDMSIAPPETKEKKKGNYFSGSVSLSVPMTDSEWLSELNCYVRHNCVEAFSAKEGACFCFLFKTILTT